jgi:two-component system chemotaxis response regulator CheY
MPKMSGLDVLKAVRAHPQLAKLPIIMLTAVNLHDQVLEAINAGVNNYMVKPFTIGVLTDKLVKTWANCKNK